MISLGFGYADATDAKQFKQTSLFLCFPVLYCIAPKAFEETYRYW